MKGKAEHIASHSCAVWKNPDSGREDVGCGGHDDDFLHLGGGSFHVTQRKHSRLPFLLLPRCSSSDEGAGWRWDTHRHSGVQIEEVIRSVPLFVSPLSPPLSAAEDEQHTAGAHAGEEQAHGSQPGSGEGAFRQAAGNWISEGTDGKRRRACCGLLTYRRCVELTVCRSSPLPSSVVCSLSNTRYL